MNRYTSTIFASLGVVFWLLMFLPLSFIPEAWAEYDQEPEDFYLLIFWASLLALLCMAWFTSFISLNKKANKAKIFSLVLGSLLMLVGTFLLLATVVTVDSALGIGVGVFSVVSGLVVVATIKEKKHVI